MHQDKPNSKYQTFAQHINQRTLKQNFICGEQRTFGRELQNLSQRGQKKCFSPGKINSEALSINRKKSQYIPSLSHNTTIQNESNSLYKKNLTNTGSTIPRSSSTMEEEPRLEDFVELVEVKNISNPQMVGPYADEIFQFLDENEINYIAPPSYMENFQIDINAKMRQILIDWLIEVQINFKLSSSTLFLTVNLIDRYLAQNRISRTQLQLIGVASMFIASKYEEIYPPELKDFVYICDKAYNKQEILKAEGQILQCVKFNLTYTSPLRFLERYIAVAKQDSQNLEIFKTEEFYLAQYFLELGLHEYECLQFQPSLQAASALYLSQKILNQQIDYPSIYTESSLKRCARTFLLLTYQVGQFQAVSKKFSTTNYLAVSKKDFKF